MNFEKRHKIIAPSTGSYPSIEIEYSDEQGKETIAKVNGIEVDVSDYEWNDFDGFIEACVEEWQKAR